MLLDNGRTNALADEVGRQALRCIRCSACLNVCPVYERTGGHAYGSVYPGPIGAILTPLLQRHRRDEQTDSLPYASLAVRRLLRGLPGAHRHPRGARRTCAPRWSTPTAAACPSAEAVAMRAAAWTFSDARRLGRAERPPGSPAGCSAGSGVRRCPAAARGRPAARAGRRLDRGPRPAGAAARSPSAPGGGAPAAGRADGRS